MIGEDLKRELKGLTPLDYEAIRQVWLEWGSQKRIEGLGLLNPNAKSPNLIGGSQKRIKSLKKAAKEAV